MRAAMCLLGLAWLAPLGAPAGAEWIEVNMGGEVKRIWSAPHVPFLTVGTLDELREHWETVRPVLPEMPFIMQGQWVIPGKGDAPFRTFPDDPDLIEIFSPNGDYVVRTYLARVLATETADGPIYELMTTAGELLRQTSEGPDWHLVTDDGRVIARSLPFLPLRVTVYDAAGEVIAHLGEVFTGDSRWFTPCGPLRLVPQFGLVLAKADRQLVALDYAGHVLWRFSIDDTPRSARIGRVDLDPLGRGFYVGVHDEGETTIQLIDPQTGAAVGAVWRHKPVPVPRYFSARGRYAGLVSSNAVGIADWETGEVLFFTADVEANGKVDVWVRYTDACSVSDSPPLLAVPLRTGDAVLDASGQTVWSVDLRGVGYRRMVLASDAQVLGVAAGDMKAGRFEMSLTLLYRVGGD